MNGLTFAQPVWFWGLLVLIPLVVLRAWAHWHAARRLPGLVAPRLASRLISGSSHSRRWTVFSLHCLALAATLTALARPILGFTEIETETDARNLIIAIDTSRSMMADDLPPNRLTRAQLAAKDIILSLPDDRVGLIAFAGRPFVQAPLTVDHEAVLEAIDQLDTEIIPRGGTNLSAATKLALETFKEAKLEQSALVLFSDGEALEGIDQVEKIRDEAAAAGMSILTVGVGTAEGAIIPEVDDNGVPVPGLFVKDDQGQVVRTRLVADALQALSSRGGAYVHLGGKASLTRVVEQIRQGLASSREESETRLRPIERFMWPLSAAVAFLVLAHLLPLFWLKPAPGRNVNPASVKRLATSLALFAGSILFATGPAAARDSINSGFEAYQESDYAAAIEAYEGALTERHTAKDRTRLHMGIGAAAYRMGNFERAAEAYGQALVEGNETLRSQTHYNLGNTLFRQGEAGLKPAPQAPDPDQPQNLSGKSATLEDTIRDWEASIGHFETTLSLDPDNHLAAHNLELVKKRLEELKKQKEEEQKKEEEKKKEDEKKEEKDDKEEKKEDEKKEDEKKEDEKKEDEKKEDEKKEDKGDKEQPKDENGDGKPDDQQQEPGKEDPKNPGGDQPKDDQAPGDPKEGEGEKPDPKDPSDKPQPDDGKPGDQKPPQNPGQNTPPQPDAPQDGELEANPNQEQPGQSPENQPQGKPGEAQAAEKMMNPTTGYSPSEARQLIDSLADETEVRPLVQPTRGEKFKNW
jgi:Ca-activated chloride channel homolog